MKILVDIILLIIQTLRKIYSETILRKRSLAMNLKPVGKNYII